jgi:SAM-dependent methyltransferase
MLQRTKTALVRGMVATTGYRLARARPSETFRPAAVDRAERAPFLAAILPVVQANTATGRYPTPAFLRRYFSPKRLAMSRLLVDECERLGVRLAGADVLDVGCHAGYLLRLLARRHPDARLFGCDVYADKVAMAHRACPTAEVWRAQLAELADEARYDVVFFNEVLEHTRDPEAVLRRLVRLKRPGGWLVLSVPDGREDTFPAMSYHPEFDAFGGHVNFWSPESWQLFVTRLCPDREVHTAKLAFGCLLAAIR